MKNKIKFNEESKDDLLKKKICKLRKSPKPEFEVGLITDANGQFLKTGDLVDVTLNNGEVLTNCEIVEVKEYGMLTVAYDDLNNNDPIELHEVHCSNAILI
jgi:hypothetical protein